MTNETSEFKLPPGMHSVTPHLVCARADAAIEFYKQAFDATELSRMPGPAGKIMYASFRIGDSGLMLSEEMPPWKSFGPKALQGTPGTLPLYVQ